jgi:hypothetical protein
VPNSYDPALLLMKQRMYLRSLLVCRLPRDQAAPYATLPPMWNDPREGVPYPGQTEGLATYETNADMVLGAYPSTGIPSRPYEAFYRQKGVTIFIRGRTSPIIQDFFEHKLYPNLHDIRNVDMDGLQVNQVMCIRDLQRIGADANGYVYNCEFLFDMWGPDVADP